MTELTTLPEEIVAFRQAVYELFSNCFLLPPTLERLPFLADSEWRASASAVLGPEIEILARDLLNNSDPDRLAVEHAALFVVPGPQQTFPYESNYRERRVIDGEVRPGLRLGCAAVEVVETYLQWGMRQDLETGELPDHAGVELRFMSLLASAERLAREVSVEDSSSQIIRAEVDFLNQHILQWFPPWLECVSNRAREPFYRSAAAVLKGFLATEVATLDQLVAAGPAGPRCSKEVVYVDAGPGHSTDRHR